MAGGPFGMGFAATVDGSTSGVSGANDVAGEGGSDDANPGSTIGKSEMLAPPVPLEPNTFPQEVEPSSP